MLMQPRPAWWGCEPAVGLSSVAAASGLIRQARVSVTHAHCNVIHGACLGACHHCHWHHRHLQEGTGRGRRDTQTQIQSCHAFPKPSQETGRQREVHTPCPRAAPEHPQSVLAGSCASHRPKGSPNFLPPVPRSAMLRGGALRPLHCSFTR
jgi:hypothetical protein